MLCVASCGTCWGAVAATYINQAGSSSDLTTYSFGDFNASGSGLMVVVASGRSAGTPTISSVSIGGTNGTIVDQINADGNVIGIATRAVSSGNQAVSVTFSTGMVRAQVGVWLVTGYNSATPYDTDKGSGVSTSATRTLDYPTNGAGIYGLFLQSNSPTTISFNNASERYEVAPESNSTIVGGDRTATGLATGETISWSGSLNFVSIGACWEESSGGGGSVPVIFRNWLNHSSLQPKPQRVVRAAYIQPFAAQLLSGSPSLSP